MREPPAGDSHQAMRVTVTSDRPPLASLSLTAARHAGRCPEVTVTLGVGILQAKPQPPGNHWIDGLPAGDSHQAMRVTVTSDRTPQSTTPTTAARHAGRCPEVTVTQGVSIYRRSLSPQGIIG